ncbi:MAG: phage integrase SAM-like domain-containing protein, partial [Bacteroidetes bacterium]|nr:phage integrase SAM-like domain-containing protein [Bacteroidota bacterium]
MNVKLRSKKLSDGSQSLYLDIYIKGVRQYEFLGIKITKNDPQRKHKKQIAEMKRAKKELEVMANYHDVPQNFNGDEDFIEYFKNNAKNPTSKSVFHNFNDFVKAKTIKGKFPFKLVSEKLIEEYKSYLENHYKNSTAWMYLIKLKTILNKAVKDKLISIRPAKFIKNNFQNSLIIGPDIESFQWASSVADQINFPFTVLRKKRFSSRKVSIKDEGQDFRGKKVVIVDDVISSGNTILETVKLLKRRGVSKINVVCTHGIFSENALSKIKKAGV